MKNSLKLISLLLLSALLTSSFASCGASSDTQPKETQNSADSDSQAAETTAATEADIHDTLTDSVPELDFEGASFRTIVQDSTIYDIYVAEETGDTLEDTIYYRNRAIEERFNVKIAEALSLSFGEISSRVSKMVNSGDDEYDLIIGQMETEGVDAVAGYFKNWYDIPYLDFSMPWYPKSIIENAATVNGKMFNMISDLCISYAEQTWSIIYDKVIAENYGITDVYSTVRDGDWTIDKLTELTKNVYTDLNGDGAADETDYYGYTTALNGCLLLSYFYGFNQRLVTVENNEINMVLNTEKAASISEKLYSLYYESTGTVVTKDASNAGMYTMFVNGKTLFCPIQLQYLYSQLRDYENDFGILPFPKWDAAQEEYYSVCDAGSNIIAVPVTAQNTELIGAMVESLSAYSWKSVLPTYYDIALNTKSARDEESVEMMDIILNNRVIDFAYLYDGWNGWVFSLSDLIKEKGAFSSKYASLESKKLTYYQKVLDFFLED